MTLSRTHQATKPDESAEIEALRVGLSAARVEAYAQRAERQRAEAALAVAEREILAVRLVCNQIESMPIPVDPGMSQTEITGRVVSTIIKAVRSALAIAPSEPDEARSGHDQDRLPHNGERWGSWCKKCLAPNLVIPNASGEVEC